jgi:hypothetical protein
MASLHQLLQKFKRDERGLAFLELAYSVPILVILLLGGVEISRYVFVHQKLERAAVTMADLLSQAYTLHEGEMAGLFEASAYVMNPFDMHTSGYVIASSIASESGGSATVMWQRTLGGAGGSGGGGSRFGTQGGPALLPPDFTVREGDSVIAAEAYYAYTPIFFDFLLSPRVIQSSALFRPRFADLTEIN